jgi:hypothetical protein
LPTDDHREPSAPPVAAAKPSLIDNRATPRFTPHGEARSLRLLDELESVIRPKPGRTATHAWGPVVITIMLLVVTMAAAWWWTQSRAANEAPSREQFADRAGAMALVESPPSRARESSDTAMSAAPPAALIEALPEQQPARAEPGAPAVVQAAAGDASRAGAPTRIGANAPAALATKADSPKAKRPANPPVVRVRQVATSSAVPAGRSGAPDADVLLLSALLEHASSESHADSPGPQAPMTIAQLVQRCEARGGKSAVQVRDCRRRICEGYWGKAEACPARLAPREQS